MANKEEDYYYLVSDYIHVTHLDNRDSSPGNWSLKNMVSKP